MRWSQNERDKTINLCRVAHICSMSSILRRIATTFFFSRTITLLPLFLCRRLIYCSDVFYDILTGLRESISYQASGMQGELWQDSNVSRAKSKSNSNGKNIASTEHNPRQMAYILNYYFWFYVVWRKDEDRISMPRLLHGLKVFKWLLNTFWMQSPAINEIYVLHLHKNILKNVLCCGLHYYWWDKQRQPSLFKANVFALRNHIFHAHAFHSEFDQFFCLSRERK